MLSFSPTGFPAITGLLAASQGGKNGNMGWTNGVRDYDDKPTIVDVAVDPAENCFPMVPSGAAHNEMILGSDDKKVEISSDGLTLV